MSVQPNDPYPHGDREPQASRLSLTQHTLEAIHFATQDRLHAAADPETSENTQIVLFQEAADHMKQSHKIDIHTTNMRELPDMSVGLFSYISLQVDALDERMQARHIIRPYEPIKHIRRFEIVPMMTGINQHIRKFRSGNASAVSPIRDQEKAEIKRFRERLTKPVPVTDQERTPTGILQSVPEPVLRGANYPEASLVSGLLAAAEREDAPVAQRALEIIEAIMGNNLPPLRQPE